MPYEDDMLSEAGYGADAPDDNFAYVPKGEAPSKRKLPIGDKTHAHEAVVAVANKAYRGKGLDIPASAMATVKHKVAAAVRKFYTGDEQKRLLKWLETGKKPEAVSEMISFDAPDYRFGDETNYPEVPTLDGVDWVEIQRNDPKPLIVTRPLGILNDVSRHGIIYDEDLLQSLESQIRSKRPVARQGHIPEDDRDFSFPDDKAIWIGVLRNGATLYGKAYILPGTHFCTMVWARKAAGTELKTSIWGLGAYVDAGNGMIRCVNLDLESIDFVPAERASLQALPGQFDITSEMGDGRMSDQHADANDDLALLKNAIASIDPSKVAEVYQAVKGPQFHELATAHMKDMGGDACYEMLSEAQRGHVAAKHVKEVSPQEVYEMLTEGQRKHVAETETKANGSAVEDLGQTVTGQVHQQVAEMSGKLDSAQKQLAEMATQLNVYRRKDFETQLDKGVDTYFAGFTQLNTEKGKQGLAHLKDNLRFRALAEMSGMNGGQTEANIKAGLEAAWPNVKPLTEMFVSVAGGPNAIVGVTTAPGDPGANNSRYGFDPKTGRYSDDAVARARTLSNVGIPQQKEVK